jgi:hypothetical protein
MDAAATGMRALLFAAFLLPFPSAAVLSAQEPAEPEGLAVIEEKAPTEQGKETANGEDRTLRENCDLPDLGSDSWIDRMHRAIYRSVCGSAFWFDSFFGEENSDRDREATFGRLALGPEWSDHDGLTARARFKVRINLPRFEKRLNAFFGSYKEDEFAPDRTDTFGSLPEVFRNAADREWLLGLGYSPFRNSRRRVDLDAGVKLGFPMDPFVRLRVGRHRFVGDLSLLRFRQTLFWRGEKGVGTTSHVDVERVLGPTYHLRWRSEGTLAEAVAGVDWESSLILYQYLGGSRALAYEVLIEGETDAAVPVKEYGFRTVYRQSLFREWFFTEVRGALTWPKEELAEVRRESFGLGFSFEILFGNHP